MPALVLFSIGGIAATVGTPSVLVWTLSVLFGFIQAFTYAEIAGLFPNKSGGASVYGAAAWVRYSKFIAPLSVWCNWLAWTPVLAIGCGIAAGYILNALFPADAAIRTWEIQLLDLGFLKEGLKLRLNSTFFIGAILIAISFAIQHRGILSTAKVQTIVGVAVLLPLLIIGIVPLITGDVAMSAFQPFAPGTDPATAAWNKAGWTLFFGGLFIAAWSAYAFETAICYTSEFRDPATDTYKAILYSGLLCIAVYILVPLSFQGALGLGRRDGSGHRRRLGRGASHGLDGRRRRVHHQSPGGDAAARADARHHHGDGRQLAHAVPGLGRRLAAALSEPCEQERRADARHVDRPHLQSHPAVDVGLSVRARGLQCLLPRVQLPEPQRGLDPPHRQRACEASVEGAGLAAWRPASCSPSSTPSCSARAPMCGARAR